MIVVIEIIRMSNFAIFVRCGVRMKVWVTGVVIVVIFWVAGGGGMIIFVGINRVDDVVVFRCTGGVLVAVFGCIGDNNREGCIVFG